MKLGWFAARGRCRLARAQNSRLSNQHVTVGCKVKSVTRKRKPPKLYQSRICRNSSKTARFSLFAIPLYHELGALKSPACAANSSPHMSRATGLRSTWPSSAHRHSPSSPRPSATVPHPRFHGSPPTRWWITRIICNKKAVTPSSVAATGERQSCEAPIATRV